DQHAAQAEQRRAAARCGNDESATVTSGTATRANCSKRRDSVLGVRSGERAAANLNPTRISLDMDGSEH
ncbi:hypothetical protein Dimus_024798, partial [Dionaea muscipula]